MDQFSATIANILSGELQSFNRSEYLGRGKSDYEGFLEKGIFNGVSVNKATLYNAFIKTNNNVITLEIDQDYASMGSIYTNNALSSQITQVDVVLKTGEIIQKNMGRMPNYNYIGSGIYRTSIQLNPPVQGMNESTKVIKLNEIESIIIHAPNDVLVKLIL